MVELSGIEPLTSCVQGRRSPSWAIAPICLGFSWFGLVPFLFWWLIQPGFKWWVWVDLNHRPHPYQGCALTNWATDPDIYLLISSNVCGYLTLRSFALLKEVIQPQVPLGLPCYDFTPVMNHKVVSDLPKVSLPTSFATHSHGVTGGVYKARERIHRSILICDY